ncbi:hypothetical protein ATCC90586_010321 [Pythium insidiosum]|nr:hypothetical protein ATCC90586_010321 [Pythium insidiosum]
MQAGIHHEFVLIYFCILKQATYATALPAVLDGLGKFVFLINLDLLMVLKAALKEELQANDKAFVEMRGPLVPARPAAVCRNRVPASRRV